MEAQGMVERVAAAILAEAQNMGGLAFTFPIEKRLAIAAIKAMREPSEEMIMSQGKSKAELAPNERARESAGRLNQSVRRMAKVTYQEMIDAALNDQDKVR